MLNLKSTNTKDEYTRIYFITNGNKIKEVFINNYDKAKESVNTYNKGREMNRYYIVPLSPECDFVFNKEYNFIDVILLNREPYKVYINNTQRMYIDFDRLDNDDYREYGTWCDIITEL